jgi:hypothetical protein
MAMKLLHIVSPNEEFLFICSCGKPTDHCGTDEKIARVQPLPEEDSLIWPIEVRFKNCSPKPETPPA